MSPSSHTVVVFDGECVVCNGWVDFLMRFDRKDVFRFAALQSEAGARIAQGETGSILLADQGRVLMRSEAVLGILERLGFPFSVASVFRLIPLRLRDAIYDWIARNRIKWFGKRNSCRLPTPEERGKFL